METKVYVRDSVPSDLGELIRSGLRESDYKEAQRITGDDPYQAVYDSFADSCIRKTVVNDGRAIGLFGVINKSILSANGTVWFVATDEVEDFPMAFATISHAAVREMVDGYDSISNLVDSHNTKSIRWLRWMGFTVEPDLIPCGPFRHPFRFFSLRGDVCA